MAQFGFKFGNCIVGNNGSEIEATCPSCEGCKLRGTECPYDQSCGCLGGARAPCHYYIPKEPHVYYGGQWWS